MVNVGRRGVRQKKILTKATSSRDVEAAARQIQARVCPSRLRPHRFGIAGSDEGGRDWGESFELGALNMCAEFLNARKRKLTGIAGRRYA
jgi:hypothetical protein